MDESLIKLSNTNNVTDIKQILTNYQSDDWNDIIKDVKVTDCCCNNYHKILLLSNNNMDVYLIVWFPGAETPIHDHPNGGCVVKLLKGQLTEIVYENIENSQAVLLKTNCLNEGDISYKTGNKILHKIKSTVHSISIHVYLPPNYKQNVYRELSNLSQ